MNTTKTYTSPEAEGVYSATGEFRAPKAGEYYLSGAIVEAYRAPNDLSTPYHIAREVLPDPVAEVYIDMTPTWGEWANIVKRLAQSLETRALEGLWPDFARMAASCEALKRITGTLTEEQQRTVAEVMTAELTKQGY